MENHDFLPRLTPLDGEGLRDLPPMAPPLPRMENRPEGAGAGDCGCGSGHGHGHHHGACGDSHPSHSGACGQDGGHEGCGACHGHEGCGEGSWGLAEYPLAMVYAPCQSFRALYDTATALSRGTLFTELDLPLGGEGGFTAEGCACRAERRRT